jgi:Uma2 family endonuclease
MLEDYFEQERTALDRHEYLNGEIFAMAGGTAAHSIITLNVGGELREQLKGRDCTAYNGDMRVALRQQTFTATPMR